MADHGRACLAPLGGTSVLSNCFERRIRLLSNRTRSNPSRFAPVEFEFKPVEFEFKPFECDARPRRHPLHSRRYAPRAPVTYALRYSPNMRTRRRPGATRIRIRIRIRIRRSRGLYSRGGKRSWNSLQPRRDIMEVCSPFFRPSASPLLLLQQPPSADDAHLGRVVISIAQKIGQWSSRPADI